MKTSELQGAALDWAVAKALGILALKGNHVRVAGKIYPRPAYSSDWSKGGPIIERERIELIPLWSNDIFEGYAASHRLSVKYDDEGEFIYGSDCKQYNHAPLIAAMRCYVASKLGDTIDIPEELQ